MNLSSPNRPSASGFGPPNRPSQAPPIGGFPSARGSLLWGASKPIGTILMRPVVHYGQPRPGQRIVLYVEDNQANFLVIQKYFASKRPDLFLSGATSGRLGMAQLRLPAKPAALLLDINLGDMSGMDILRWLKGDDQPDAALAAVPVIIVTADAAGSLGRECMAAGAVGFVTKPVEFRMLEHFLALAGLGPPAPPQPPPLPR